MNMYLDWNHKREIVFMNKYLYRHLFMNRYL